MLDDLALGATLLGSGGGGDPSYDLLIAKRAIEEFGLIPLIDVDTLSDDAFVAPVAFMGAPLVMMEKISSGREFLSLIPAIEESMGRKITHLLAAEIGGGNSLTPIVVAAKLKLPILDADTLGRAFPELQMSSCNLFGISPSPAFLADSHGRTVKVEGSGGKEIEDLCRDQTVKMGSSAACSLYFMDGRQAKKSVVKGSFTRAITLGKTLRHSSRPLEELGATLLAKGVIVDINQTIEEGFLKGSFTIHGDQTITVFYQNEFLMAFDGKTAIAATPDIIIPLEASTLKPITSESLTYGMRVVLISLPSPEIWKSPEGLKLVGPKYFGYGDESHV